MRVIGPSETEYLVSKGACLFYKKKVLRIADATYGTGVSVKYDHSNPIHKPAFKTTIDGVDYCENLFSPYICIGDHIDSEFVYSSRFLPRTETQESVSFPIYSTPDHHIDYTKKENDSLPDKLERLGYLKVDISSGKHLPHNDRRVQFAIDFSSTEIRAYGWFIHDENKTPVKTTCDFLSTIDNIKKFAK